MGKDTSFALHSEKVLFSLEFLFKFWKRFAGIDKTRKKNSILRNSDKYRLPTKSYRIKAVEFESFGII